MGYKEQYSEHRGPTLEGLEGERWKDVQVGDFIRGTLARASVQTGTTLNGEPEKKLVMVLTSVVGMMDGGKVSAPVASLIADGGRGSALAEALDDVRPGCTIQVHLAATKPGATTGTRKLWTVKVWPEGRPLADGPGVVVDMRTWGEKRTPAWAAPSGAVAAL